MDWNKKKVLVVGAGKTGIAVADFLSQKGALVTLTDAKPWENFKKIWDKLNSMPINLALGEYPKVDKQFWDVLVVSPGISPNILPIKTAYELNIPVLGELELAFTHTKAPFVAITGTNGKTTTTTLVGQIYQDAGYKTLVAGNIGLPLIEKIEDYRKEDIIVAEVSSFQLETIASFRPRVSAVLNITPDHLDRHKNMQNYQEVKAKIFLNQEQNDYTILNYDDLLTREMDACSKGKVIFFSTKHNLEEGAFVEKGNLVLSLNGERKNLFSIEKLKIPGRHNIENALAAILCGAVMGLSLDKIIHTVTSFKGVSHRLEFVAKVKGVSYVNDSKGTNPDASIKAIEAYKVPLVLIAGGRNKGNDFTEFLKVFKAKARALVLLGECADELEQKAIEVDIPKVLRACDLKDAVRLASLEALEGDIVLLSPACASWDMFSSFEQRGNLFKDLVFNLK